MKVSQLIEYTRYILSESEASFWTDEELLSYLNRAYEACYRKAVASDRGYGAIWFDWDNNSLPPATSRRTSVWSITLPHCIWKVLEVRKGANDSYSRLEARFRDETSGEVDTWSFTGSHELTIYGNEPENLRILAYRTPIQMHLGTFGTVSSGTAVLGATTGQLQSAPWAYNGAIITPLSGNANGVPLEVTSYDRSTNTATYRPVGGGDPNAGDEYEVSPDMDETHHEVLCYMAANRALTKENNVAGKSAIQDILNALYREYIDGLVPRQSQSMRHVRPRKSFRQNNPDRF